MLSRRDFEKYAAYCKRLVAAGEVTQAQACHKMIVETNDNPQFDAERFRKACGL